MPTIRKRARAVTQPGFTCSVVSALSSGMKSDCVAVDWIGRNLYWVDGAAGQISAIQLTAVWRGRCEHTIVLGDDLAQPRSLALDPLNG